MSDSKIGRDINNSISHRHNLEVIGEEEDIDE